MRVVRQNTFIIFINGYLVLNEEQKNQMRSLLTNLFSIPNLGNFFVGVFLLLSFSFEVESFTSEQYDLISKISE